MYIKHACIRGFITDDCENDNKIKLWKMYSTDVLN